MMQSEANGNAPGRVAHPEQDHILSLDGLRALAALLVVFSHFRFIGVDQFVYGQIGNYGVFLFFVLSGFLMGHLYLTKTITRDRLAVYTVARIARIVPLYYTTLIGAYIYTSQYDSKFEFAMSAMMLIRHFLFVGSTSVFWSIAPEFQFYFIFPLLWWLLSQSKQVLLRWGLPAAGILSVIVLYRAAWPGILVFSKLHIFLGGVLLAMLRRRVAPQVTVATATSAQILAMVGLAVLFLPADLVGQTIYPPTGGVDVKLNMYYADIGKLMPLMFVVFVFSFDTRFSLALLGNLPMRKIGAWSFSLYLLHFPVMYACKRLGVFDVFSYGIAVPLVILIAITVAAASYFVIERPGQAIVRLLLLRAVGMSRDGLRQISPADVISTAR